MATDESGLFKMVAAALAGMVSGGFLIAYFFARLIKGFDTSIEKLFDITRKNENNISEVKKDIYWIKKNCERNHRNGH